VARALLITNPVAARTNDNTIRQVARELERGGWQLEVATTTGPGHAGVLARQGRDAGVDVVAVYAGDGTTMQAAAQLIGTDTPLGLVPGGTGNLLAGNLRLPSHPARAAQILMRGARRRIDLGRVELPDGTHYFGVACGAGVDARVMGGTAAADKRRWGIGAYFASTFRVLAGLRSTSCMITVDDQEPFEVRAALVLVMNCGEMIPPLVRVRPEITIDDGMLDLVTVTADSGWQGIRGLFRVVIDGRRRVIRETGYIQYRRGTRMRVVPSEPLPVQFDGDPVGVTPFTAEVVPGCLTVLTA
jgi:diacylglycerol kinase (ATP)